MKIRRFENDNLIQYEFNTFEEGKALIEEWKREFREINNSDRVEKTRKDYAYESYAKQLDEDLLFIISKEMNSTT